MWKVYQILGNLCFLVRQRIIETCSNVLVKAVEWTVSFKMIMGTVQGLHNPGKLLVHTQDRCPLIYNGNTLLWTSQSTIHLLD